MLVDSGGGPIRVSYLRLRKRRTPNPRHQQRASAQRQAPKHHRLPSSEANTVAGEVVQAAPPRHRQP